MKIVFLFYDGMTTLDATGPYEILWRLPDVSVTSVSSVSGEITSCSGLVLKANKSISEVQHADILLVPGASKAMTLREYPDVLNWIKKIHANTIWTTSVCTGSLILGAAGLLSGEKATTHRAALDRLKKWGAEPIQDRIVTSGKIMTAAGVSAGIDMALTLAAKVSGKQVAKSLQLGIEYDPEPPFDCGSLDKAEAALFEPLQEEIISKFEKD